MSFTIQEQLFRVAIIGNAQDMSNLLLQKPELNIHDNTGMSLVYAAATYQREEVVSQLLAAGADSNIQNWTGTCSLHILQNKYLNNLIEQDHRVIKKRTKPMLGFKSFRSAKITIAGIENIRMIQKGQIVGANYQVSTFKHFRLCPNKRINFSKVI